MLGEAVFVRIKSNISVCRQPGHAVDNSNQGPNVLAATLVKSSLVYTVRLLVSSDLKISQQSITKLERPPVPVQNVPILIPLAIVHCPPSRLLCAVAGHKLQMKAHVSLCVDSYCRLMFGLSAVGFSKHQCLHQFSVEQSMPFPFLCLLQVFTFICKLKTSLPNFQQIFCMQRRRFSQPEHWMLVHSINSHRE